MSAIQVQADNTSTVHYKSNIDLHSLDLFKHVTCQIQIDLSALDPSAKMCPTGKPPFEMCWFYKDIVQIA